MSRGCPGRDRERHGKRKLLEPSHPGDDADRRDGEVPRSDAEPDPNALEGARGVAVGDAAWESIRTGKPARVKRDF